MSGPTWVIADPHFGHSNINLFARNDGTPLRPWGRVLEDGEIMSDEEKMRRCNEMDEALVDNWNSVVSPTDRVYLLGDIAMNKQGYMKCVPKLNGRKVLVKGNHDELKLSVYSQHFDDIRACAAKHGFIMTHIPIHPESLARWKVNIHGHLHYNKVLLPDGTPDTRYQCVSVEHINYTPKLLDEVLHEAGVK